MRKADQGFDTESHVCPLYFSENTHPLKKKDELGSWLCGQSTFYISMSPCVQKPNTHEKLGVRT